MLFSNVRKMVDKNSRHGIGARRRRFLVCLAKFTKAVWESCPNLVQQPLHGGLFGDGVTE